MNSDNGFSRAKVERKDDALLTSDMLSGIKR
jgi:hypothetical protein